MNKLFKIAFAGAVALAALASCAKKEAPSAAVNPNFNEEEGTVKTQFVLNVSTSNAPTTKMTAANTQATTSETFRGMEEVALLTYELAANGNHLYDISTPALATAKRKYSLGQLLNTGTISESNSRRVIELSLPVGTNTLLFYGKAPKGALTDDEAGSVTMDVQEDATNTSFTINPRMTAENQVIFTETTDLIATALTALSNAGLKQYTEGVEGAAHTRDLRYAFYWPVNSAADVLDVSSMDAAQLAALPADGDPGTGVHASQTFHIGSITWAELGEKYELNNDANPANDVYLSPFEEILGQAHSELTNMRVMGGGAELRAGSGDALQYLVTDIFSLAKRVNTSVPSFWQGQAAVLLAGRIIDILATCFDTSTTPVTYRAIATIKNAIENNVYGKPASGYSHVNDLATFPENINLPKGAAILDYAPATKTWSYKTELPTYGLGGGAAGTTQIAKYLYPAELMYFGNSPVRVTDDAHETNHYPATVATWDNDATWAAGDLAGATGWTKDGKVKSTTRSVAMQKDINYGTALLKTTVKYGNATLQDNNAAIQADRTGAVEANNTITVAGDSFELVGVIVGGAIQTVGWNFVNKGSTFDYLIYDGEIANGAISSTVGTPTDPVYTLVWDNWNSALANDAQTPVYVALEFVNNAKDFWGHANKVRKGGTFYLTGKLDPAGLAFPSRTATNYAQPPYADADGSTITASRVFIQDFVTVANFTISETSLQHAYVTVPDLRSSEISLGLSVDIKWETGFTFNDIVLGE